MAERSARRDAVAGELLELLDLRKSPLLLARPDGLAVNPHLEDAAGRIGCEDDGADLLCERRQQLLRHPPGAQPPSAEAAVDDLDRRARGHVRAPSCRPGQWHRAGGNTNPTPPPSSAGGNDLPA